MTAGKTALFKTYSMLNQKLLQDPEVIKIVRQALLEEIHPSCIDVILDKFLKKNTKPPVILTTEDGVDVTDAQTTIYCVNFRLWQSNTYSAGLVVKNINVDMVKFFSTPEARDEYILWNKPVLSGKDVKKYVQLISDNDKNRLTALLKSKIK